AALFTGAGSPCAPFQSVQQLLTGNGLQTGYVAEGVDALAGLVGNVTGDGGIAHAAAVHNGYIHVHIHAVKQVVQSVCGEVAGVGLLTADQTGFVAGIVVQSQSGGTNHGTQLLVDFLHPGILDGSHGSVAAPFSASVQVGDQLVAHNFSNLVAVFVLHRIAVVTHNGFQDFFILDEIRSHFAGFGADDHQTDAVKILTGLRQHHVVAVFVSHFLAFHGAVGVTVNESGQAGYVGNGFFTG